MAGEQWRQVFQAGKETTPGMAVAATRKLYGNGNMIRDRAMNVINVSTGTRDTQRDAKARAVTAGGNFTQELSADEIIELLLLGMKGGVTPTTSLGASTWVFTPGTPDSATMEFYDGYRGWAERGVMLNQLKISGNASGDATVAVDLFGTEMVPQAITASLAERVPDFLQGWEGKLYIDAFGGTAGTTYIANTAISFDFTLQNNFGRKYYLDNTTATGAITTGKVGLMLDMVMEGNAAAMTEYTNRETAVKRLIRLELGNNVSVGTGTAKKSVLIDLPCVASAVDLTPEDQGTKVYKFSFQYIYDPTNAFSARITVVNGRTTAW